MIRLAAIALMIPAVAFGQSDHISKCPNNDGQLVDCGFSGKALPMPWGSAHVSRRCAVLVFFRVTPGETITGALDANPEGPNNVRLEKGSTLTGLIEIENCDGVVTIRTDGK